MSWSFLISNWFFVIILICVLILNIEMFKLFNIKVIKFFIGKYVGIVKLYVL